MHRFLLCYSLFLLCCIPPAFFFFFSRYVEDRFPQLLMHCTKVTGLLLTEERIFKEYLVPFRRPQPPVTGVQSSTPGASAATTTDGSSSERSVAPQAAAAAAAAADASLGNKATPAGGELGGAEADRAATVAGGRGEKGGDWDSSGAAEDAEVSNGSARQGVEGNSSASFSNGGTAAAATGGAAAAAAAAFTSPGKRSAKTTPRSGRKSYNPSGSDRGGGGDGGGGAPVRVTEQNGPRGEGALQDVLIWNESGMAKNMGCRCVGVVVQDSGWVGHGIGGKGGGVSVVIWCILV